MSLFRRLASVFFHVKPEAPAPPTSPGTGAVTGAPTGQPLDSRTREPGDAKLPVHVAPELVQPTHALFAIREPVRRTTAVLLGAIPLLLVLGLWWLVTRGATPEERVISPVILPSPGEVLASARGLWQRYVVASSLLSLGRVSAGFLTAALVAVPLGIAMGTFTKVRALFNPLSAMGSYLPIAAIVPLTLSWFGIGEMQKVMFFAIASFVCLLPLVVKAIDDVDPVYLDTAYTLGANRWQAMTKVLVAVALPNIFNAVRLTFGVGWTYIILAEMIDTERGLGALIIISQRRGPREHIYLVLVVIMGLAFVIDQAFVLIGRFLFPYRADER